jgi:hypothetical protein
MAHSDWPDPDDIPDMSIPESKPPSRRPERRPEPASHGWQVGDRVLAPWEPQFLYAGRIARIEQARALIEFDDGDAGWVLIERIAELTIERDQEVLSRKRMGPFHHPALVRQLRDDAVLVEFADGSGDEWVPVAALRIFCRDAGPGAEPTNVRSHLAFLEHLRRGDRIWAAWQNGALFVGSVDGREKGRIHVRFDDGDRAAVGEDQVFPLVIPIGLCVMCRRKMGPQFYPGTVTDVDGERIQIQLDDGAKEWTRPAALALPPAPQPQHASASGQRRAPAAESTLRRIPWNWIIPIGVAILLIV